MELLTACNLSGIHTTIDTSGYVPIDTFAKSFPYTDLYLYDIKLVDPEEHKKYTGRRNNLIINNLRLLAERQNSYRIRIPVIRGINTSSKHLAEIRNLIKSLKNPPEGIDLLPYHKIGSSKYERFGIDNNMKEFSEPGDGELETIKSELDQLGLSISIGG